MLFQERARFDNSLRERDRIGLLEGPVEMIRAQLESDSNLEDKDRNHLHLVLVL